MQHRSRDLKDFMEQNLPVNFLKNKNLRAFLVGLGIAGFHSVITFLIKPLSAEFLSYPFNPPSMKDLGEMTLIAPGVIPLFINALLTSNRSLSDGFIYVFSSFIYGIPGGFLMTQRKTLRRIGIILIECLILLNCIVWYLLVA